MHRNGASPVWRGADGKGAASYLAGGPPYLNSVETDKGPRWFRSITIAARRYRAADGQWKDATSYRPADLSTLQLALKEALEFCKTTPLPGQAVEGDELQDLHVLADGEIVDE